MAKEFTFRDAIMRVHKALTSAGHDVTMVVVGDGAGLVVNGVQVSAKPTGLSRWADNPTGVIGVAIDRGAITPTVIRISRANRIDVDEVMRAVEGKRRKDEWDSVLEAMRAAAYRLQTEFPDLADVAVKGRPFLDDLRCEAVIQLKTERPEDLRLVLEAVREFVDKRGGVAMVKK